MENCRRRRVYLSGIILACLTGCGVRYYTKPVSAGAVPSIIQTALSLQGKPYRYSGTTPDGFDCAGYIRYVFSMHAVPLPRTTSRQANMGRKVFYKDLEPGDLVFFHTRGLFPKVTHVGLYIGGRKFIHAGSSAPAGVRIDVIDAPYYQTRFLYGRRITP